MEFKTIEGVPILSTGTYKLSSGETTFTADDLAAAVMAASDPTVTPPRIKLGHIDGRFESDPSLDAEPAMGTVRNMKLTDDGQTILGDLCDVPAWLADSMHSAYPSRSVEGGFGYTAASGHNYGFVIENLALLGTTWPGVGSIDDLRDVLTRNGSPNGDVEAKVERFVSASAADRVEASGPGNRSAEERREMASKGEAMDDGSFPIGTVSELESAKGLARTAAQRAFVEKRARALKRPDLIPDSWSGEGKAEASLDVGAIPRVFAADLRAGKLPALDEKAWPRSVEADDDGKLALVIDAASGLLRLPITITGKALNYGEPTPVMASSGSLDNLKGPRVLASWPSTPAEGPDRKVITMKINGKEIEQTVLAQRLGLAEDADEAAIYDKLGITPDGGSDDETATAPASDDATADDREPVAASAAKLPDGITAIDSKALASLQENAAAGARVAAERDAERDEADIRFAIEDGRIVASSADDWRQRFKINRDEAHKLLTAKAEDGGLAAVIPVMAREIGRAGGGDTTQDVAASAPRALPELQEAAS